MDSDDIEKRLARLEAKVFPPPPPMPTTPVYEDVFVASGHTRQFTLTKKCPRHFTGMTINGKSVHMGWWNYEGHDFGKYPCLIDCENNQLNFEHDLPEWQIMKCTYVYTPIPEDELVDSVEDVSS